MIDSGRVRVVMRIGLILGCMSLFVGMGIEATGTVGAMLWGVLVGLSFGGTLTAAYLGVFVAEDPTPMMRVDLVDMARETAWAHPRTVDGIRCGLDACGAREPCPVRADALKTLEKWSES